MNGGKLLLNESGELSITGTGNLLMIGGRKKRTKATRRKHLAKKRKTAVRLRKIKGGIIHHRRHTPEEAAEMAAAFTAMLKEIFETLLGGGTSVHENPFVRLFANIFLVYAVLLGICLMADVLVFIAESTITRKSEEKHPSCHLAVLYHR